MRVQAQRLPLVRQAAQQHGRAARRLGARERRRVDLQRRLAPRVPCRPQLQLHSRSVAAAQEGRLGAWGQVHQQGYGLEMGLAQRPLALRSVAAETLDWLGLGLGSVVRVSS